MNLNGTEYFYIRNGQGDIIGIVDGSGTQVVSYSYDTWGKLVSITGSLKDTVGVKNPYRYRGYRYDTETGLYYLQSRYYNPDWGRFVNADATSILQSAKGELLGHNLFAYCTNDPVNHSDDSGYWKLPNWAKISIGVAAIGIAVVATVATGGAAAPALIGALQVAGASAAIGAGIGGISGYISGGRSGAIHGAIDGAADGFMWGGIGAAGSSLARASTKFVFNGRGGYGYKIGKHIEVMYKNPNVDGGTISSYSNKAKKLKFRLDYDAIHSLHYHKGVGKVGKVHRSLAPWKFGKPL
ncbi:RHS repeat-associated core domain-containing protein [Clostridium manihotivorum]|nr:RHS repeat-associated core domain-containing protein [Clostridium manihotivorum]